MKKVSGVVTALDFNFAELIDEWKRIGLNEYDSKLLKIQIITGSRIYLCFTIKRLESFSRVDLFGDHVTFSVFPGLALAAAIASIGTYFFSKLTLKY
jgi:hypothetical protein